MGRALAPHCSYTQCEWLSQKCRSRVCSISSQIHNLGSFKGSGDIELHLRVSGISNQIHRSRIYRGREDIELLIVPISKIFSCISSLINLSVTFSGSGDIELHPEFMVFPARFTTMEYLEDEEILCCILSVQYFQTYSPQWNNQRNKKYWDFICTYCKNI